MKPDDLQEDLGADLSRALDAIRASTDAVPERLSERIRSNLRKEQILERLLDEIPPPQVPENLPERILSGVADRRRWLKHAFRRRLLVGAAAAALVGFGLVWSDRLASQADQPAPELLAVLDVLESWDDLTDLDLVLGSWDTADGWLLDWDQASAEPTSTPRPATKQD